MSAASEKSAPSASGFLSEHCRRGVIYRHQCSLAMSGFAQKGDIAHVQIRVAGCFNEKQACAGDGLRLGVICGWRQAHLHTHLGEIIASQDAGCKIRVAWQRYDISGSQDGAKNGSDGCHTGCKADRWTPSSSARAFSNAVQVGLWLRP